MADSKKLRFSTPPILNIFLWNIYGLVLGLVALIDAKVIDVAQPIWSWGYPTQLERIYNPIAAMGFSAMFTFQLDNTMR